jgi:uncharacterized protein (TIGR03435 family)
MAAAFVVVCAVSAQTASVPPDKTGLTGTYDFTMDFLQPARAAYPSQAPAEGASDPAPDVFAALERQLGLRLASSKAVDKVLVVDRVNVTPTEN